jgi:hypothetical protein
MSFRYATGRNYSDIDMAQAHSKLIGRSKILFLGQRANVIRQGLFISAELSRRSWLLNLTHGWVVLVKGHSL